MREQWSGVESVPLQTPSMQCTRESPESSVRLPRKFGRSVGWRSQPQHRVMQSEVGGATSYVCASGVACVSALVRQWLLLVPCALMQLCNAVCWRIGN